MTRKSLIEIIKKKQSLLCVGLDTDINKIPEFLIQEHDNPVLEFNKRIIKATANVAVAFKINTAFYESQGEKGWKNLIATIDSIPEDVFIIADAKRADIGNTSKMYARAFFEKMNADAITVAPYMGSDSVEPFFEYKNKWIILLALTSNKGSLDFQYLPVDKDGTKLYEKVLKTSSQWGNINNTMYVVGATHPEDFLSIRKIVPDHFILVPGIGAQGGDLELVLKNGLNSDFGLLINSSRGIIYASSDRNFDIAAKNKALELTNKIRNFVKF